MTATAARSFVFVTDFRVPNPGRVWSVLQRHRESLVDLGAHYVCVYGSINEPDRILVAIGVRSEQPLLNLSRSRYLLEWFDAVGVEDIPAVFIGQSVDQFDIGDATDAPSVVVAAVTPVDDVTTFVEHIRVSLTDFRSAGIRKTLIYQAFDTAHEVLLFHEMPDEDRARHWAQRSDVAAEWLAQVGVGVYPPVFVGSLRHMLRLPLPSRSSGLR